LIEVHVFSRTGRRGLSEIEGPDLVAEAKDCKSTAPEIPRRRMDNGQSECGSHCRIDCVATRPQNFEAGVGRRWSGAGNSATRAPRRLGVCRIEDRRSGQE
jgi:hypothetical protein